MPGIRWQKMLDNMEKKESLSKNEQTKNACSAKEKQIDFHRLSVSDIPKIGKKFTHF